MIGVEHVTVATDDRKTGSRNRRQNRGGGGEGEWGGGDRTEGKKQMTITKEDRKDRVLVWLTRHQLSHKLCHSST